LAGKDSFGNDLGLDLFVINADGSGEQNLTNSPGDDTQGRWAPNGKSIAFASTRRGGDDKFVYVMPIECGPVPEPCAAGEATFVSMTDPNFSPEANPTWSPDGGLLAVIARIRGAPGRIYIGSPAGGGGQRFDRADRLIGPEDLDWSPLGNLLAFTWVEPNFNDIYVVPIGDPRGWTRLTDTNGNKEPAFSPDAQYIVFTSTREQNPEVYRMTVGGAEQIPLTDSPGRDIQPDWQPYAP
jgi:Tol biopolymer transport system component